MLHSHSQHTLPVPTIVEDHDILCAKRWIAGARECGLVVFPWRSKPDDKGVMQFGQEMDGPNDYGAGTRRFMKHPAVNVMDGCRKGVVYETLCTEIGIDPDDPELCAKVNAYMAAQAATKPREFMEAAE